MGSIGAVVDDDDEVGSEEEVGPEAGVVDGEKVIDETKIVSIIFLRCDSVEPVAEVVCIRLMDRMSED